MTLPIQSYLPGYHTEVTSQANPRIVRGQFYPLDIPGVDEETSAPENESGTSFLLHLIKQFHAAYDQATEKPAFVRITKGFPAGIDTSTVRVSYTFTFDLTVEEADLPPD